MTWVQHSVAKLVVPLCQTDLGTAAQVQGGRALPWLKSVKKRPFVYARNPAGPENGLGQFCVCLGVGSESPQQFRLRRTVIAPVLHGQVDDRH